MGWTYNLAKGDAPTMDPTIAIAAVIFSALSMLAIALRAYVRYYSIRAAGVDDYLIFGLMSEQKQNGVLGWKTTKTCPPRTSIRSVL